jgi:glycosyltransferase involved in cell wall biosynthesis
MKTLGILGLNLRSLEETGQLSRFAGPYLNAYRKEFGRIFIFSPMPRNTGLLQYPGVQIVNPRWNGGSIAYQFLAPLVHREMKACDVLRVMHMTGCIPAVIVRLLYGKPFVATYGYDYAGFVWYGRRARVLLWLKHVVTRTIIWSGLTMAEKIIVTAPALADTLAARVPSKRIHVIPNGVDTAAFSPAERCDAGGETLKILFVGRLEEQKNLLYLLDELEQLSDIPLHMTIVGSGSLHNRLKEEAAGRKLPCTFSGTVPHEDLPRIIRAHDVFVLPSFQEGLSKALLEAMSCGLCCIGSNIEGIRNLIEDGETGIIAETSQTSFAGAIRRMWHDRDQRRRLGKNARAIAMAQYDLHTLLAAETLILTR